MPSCSEQRLPASGSRRFNLLRAARHLQDPKNASHLEYVKPSPAGPGWLCPEESPRPWQKFASRKLLFPTGSVPSLQQSCFPGEKGGKPCALELSSLPPALPGELGMPPPPFPHMLRLSIPQRGCTAGLALTPWASDGF